MDERALNAIQKSYDGIADKYARHLYSELGKKPLDRELLLATSPAFFTIAARTSSAWTSHRG